MSETPNVSKELDEPVDISVTIDALCEQFGLDKTNVTCIVFEPTWLTFTVIEGRTLVNGRIPTVEQRYKVTT